MSSAISRRTFLGAGVASGVAMALVTKTESGQAPADAVALARPLAIDELSTPALLIDLDRMDANLRKMADHAHGKNIGLRPHTKTHKCPIIAKMQIDLGAVGVCATKVSEAEVMVAAGVGNVLITSPVVTLEKISRVVALAKKSSGIQIVVDNAKTIDDFNEAAKAAGIVLRVILDLDTGTKRTGSAAGKPAVVLAQQVDSRDALQLDGLQAYAGHLMHITGHAQRKSHSVAAFSKAIDTKERIEKAGIDVNVLTGGGTGTFDIDSDIGPVTDLQVGSYLFMDAQYREIGDAG